MGLSGDRGAHTQWDETTCYLSYSEEFSDTEPNHVAFPSITTSRILPRRCTTLNGMQVASRLPFTALFVDNLNALPTV
jgi:hypothetical protein